MSNISERHHFIPQFFINGFIAPAQQLCVYDKVEKNIKSKSPKSIFFEWCKNNITIEGQQNDIIETKIFKYLDDLVAKQFGIIQNSAIDEIEEQKYVNAINLMIALLFHRIPTTERRSKKIINDVRQSASKAVKDIIDKIYSLPINDLDKEKFLSSISAFVHFEATKQNEGSYGDYYKVIQSQQTNFILSDYPIIYESETIYFNDLTSAVIFPLTEKKVYVGLKDKHFYFDSDIGILINLVLALQANKYFASTDKELLRVFASVYEKIIPFRDELISNYKADLFRKINT